jgi:hypothetical protein
MRIPILWDATLRRCVNAYQCFQYTRCLNNLSAGVTYKKVCMKKLVIQQTGLRGGVPTHWQFFLVHLTLDNEDNLFLRNVSNHVPKDSVTSRKTWLLNYTAVSTIKVGMGYVYCEVRTEGDGFFTTATVVPPNYIHKLHNSPIQGPL